jgi:hypothetical protein
MVSEVESGPWFARLLQWLIDIGNGNRGRELQDAVTAIRDLSDWLDKQVRGGNAIAVRIDSER